MTNHQLQLAVWIFALCLLNLLSQNALEGNGIGGELGDTFTELLDCHLFLVEVEAEGCLVIDVRLPFDIQSGGLCGVKLLWNWLFRVEELLK